MVIALEEAERTAARGELLHVAGNRVDEVADLLDERRDDERADAGDDGGDEEVDHSGGRAAPVQSVALQGVDRRIEREREQERRERPDEHPLGLQDDPHQGDRAEQDRDDHEDRARADGDDVLRIHDSRNGEYPCDGDRTRQNAWLRGQARCCAPDI